MGRTTRSSLAVHGPCGDLWIGLGLGPGHGYIDCCRSGPLRPDDPWHGGNGFGFYLAMGGSPKPNLLVGGEVNGYGKRNNAQQRDATLVGVSVVAKYYPAVAGRLYLKSGAGLGTVGAAAGLSAVGTAAVKRPFRCGLGRPGALDRAIRCVNRPRGWALVTTAVVSPSYSMRNDLER